MGIKFLCSVAERSRRCLYSRQTIVSYKACMQSEDDARQRAKRRSGDTSNTVSAWLKSDG